MATQEKEAKAAPQSQQEQQERDRKRRFDEYNKEIEALKIEIKNILDDIAIARKKEEPTGALFTEKQRLEDKLKVAEKERDRNKGSDGVFGPDLKKNQFIISSASTKRKTAALLVRNVPCND